MRQLDRALVLGGAGFLGGWVTEELVCRGVETMVVGYGAHRPGDMALAITKATVEDALADREYDALFFLAGSPSVPRSVREPAQDLHDNAGIVIDVLEALRGRERPPVVVFASSAAVYGDACHELMDEGHPKLPRSPYGVSKLAAEHYLRLYAETYEIPALSVRPFSVYGPRQRKLVVYDLLVRLLRGENPLAVQSSPEVARDFVFVRDVAQAVVALADRAPAVGEAYNLASGVSTTLRELVDELIDAIGGDIQATFTNRMRVGDPLRWRGDTSRAEALGATCRTSLVDGVRETLAWVRADLEAGPASSRR